MDYEFALDSIPAGLISAVLTYYANKWLADKFQIARSLVTLGNNIELNTALKMLALSGFLSNVVKRKKQ